MEQVYISIGSNIDPERYIRIAVNALREQFEPVAISSVYQSRAVGFNGDDFLNLVVGFHSDKTIKALSNILHAIEDANQRDRAGPKFSSRTIDLDLLLVGDQVITEGPVILPRDEITKNAFVLLPLYELAPDLIHPQLGQTVTELWDAFDQASQELHRIEFNW